MDENCEKYKGSRITILQYVVDAGHKTNPQATAKGHKEMFLNGERVGNPSEMEFIEDCFKKQPTLFASWHLEIVKD